VDNINNAIAIEIERIRLQFIDVLDQFFVSTTDTSLERWENEFNLSVANNYDLAYRRSKILSRLRGSGTITAALIKNVAESFENGTVEVIEDSTNYSFTIKFISTLGIPPNLDDLKDAIEELKPAHLAVIYEFTYMDWNDYEGYNKTLDAWDALNLTFDNFEKYKQ
jgi:uncharacterized protein YmfQ (DUF2313 family)